ncbi:hypothetical protein GQX74_005332 [Glossina fuscipes]|nr:hypothetical protein GQX74_005332 [Glossina fuscipes]
MYACDLNSYRTKVCITRDYKDYYAPQCIRVKFSKDSLPLSTIPMCIVFVCHASSQILKLFLGNNRIRVLAISVNIAVVAVAVAVAVAIVAIARGLHEFFIKMSPKLGITLVIENFCIDFTLFLG